MSIVVPYAGPSEQLAVVLTGISESDYPAELLQVVVVQCPLAGPCPPVWNRLAARVDRRWVRHDRPGFAPAGARNAGIAASDGTIIVSLDGDMVTGPGHVRAHVALQCARGSTASVGLRRFIRLRSPHPTARVFRSLAALPNLDRSGSNRPGHHHDWRGPPIARLSSHPAPYELALGCNLAYPRDVAIAAGGWNTAFDGSFGYEDIEFASRLMRVGCTLVWAASAEALHLEDDRASGWKSDRSRNFELACALIPGFREHRDARSTRSCPTEFATSDSPFPLYVGSG